MKIGWLILAGLPLFGQIGLPDPAQLWLQGHFDEAEVTFARAPADCFDHRSCLSQAMDYDFLLEQRAVYETERARFGVAASLLKKVGNQSVHVDKRLARLYFAAGEFDKAEKLVLKRTRWKGGDVRKLDFETSMQFVTLGEVYLSRGYFDPAIVILEKACILAKRRWKVDAPEWVRAQNDIALANLGLKRLPEAAEAANLALRTAQREWGVWSVPALDSMDTLGLVRIYESKFKEAEELIVQALTTRESLYNGPHPKVAASYLHAALLSFHLSNPARTVRFVKRALDIEGAITAGQLNGRWALALAAGARLLASAGQPEDAAFCYRNAIPVLERELGADAPAVVEIRQHFEELHGG